MSHSKVDLIDYIGKLLSSNDDVVKTHERVVVDLQQVVTDEYHPVDYDYHSDIRIVYEKQSVEDDKRQFKYVPTIVRYDGGSIKAFDDTPGIGDFVDWFNEGYKKTMALYFPWFEKLKLRDLDIGAIHALCGNDEADADIDRKYGLAIADDPEGVYDHSFVFKYGEDHEYASGTVMIERDRLGWDGDTLKSIVKTLTGRADEFELKPAYTFKLGETNDNIIGDMAKQLMVNGSYHLLKKVLYPAANQPNSDTVDIEVKLQHVVAKDVKPKYYRLSYNGHLLGKTAVPYATDLKEILKDNHTSFEETDLMPLLPIFTGAGDDLRIEHYRLDMLVYLTDVKKTDFAITHHLHGNGVSLLGHTHGTSAPE